MTQPRLLPWYFLFLLILLLQLVAEFGLVAEFLLPSPLAVLRVLREQDAEFAVAFFSTAGNSLLGLLLAFFSAFFCGVIFCLNDKVRMMIYPYAAFFQTVPVIAVAPLLVIWFGFGGPTIRAASMLVAFFPLLANMMAGLQSYSKEQEELLRLYKASTWQKVLQLQIPSAIRLIFVGLRVASGLAIIGAIVGEFIAGGGLGGLIDAARSQQRVDMIFAAILLSSVLGFAYLATIAFCEFLWLKHLRQI